MTVTPDASDPDGEAGFTLVEILVAMSLTIVVGFAALQGLDLFTSNAAHQTRVTDANDQVRTRMDRTVRDLRGASRVLTADATDLAYSVPEKIGVRTERLCVQSGDLYGSTKNEATATAPTASCSSGTRLARVKSTGTAFTYDGATSAATPATVRNVGLAFSLDTSKASQAAGAASCSSSTPCTTLRASAAVRRTTSTLPVGDNDVRVVCVEAGPLIQIGVGVPGDLGTLMVAYTAAGGITVGGGVVTPTGGSAAVALPSSVTSVVATITDALGITRARVEKPVGCVP